MEALMEARNEKHGSVNISVEFAASLFWNHIIFCKMQMTYFTTVHPFHYSTLRLSEPSG